LAAAFFASAYLTYISARRIRISEELAAEREVDLARHLEGETAKDTVVFGSEIGAADDYMMYQALILLKGASVLSAGSNQK